MGWTIFGKIPCEGDFVRHDLKDPIAIECFRWIADSVSHNPEWVRAIPVDGVHFVYGGASTRDRALIGTLIRSHDRVRREFPLVAVHASSSKEMARGFPAIPLAWSATLDKVRCALFEVGPRASVGAMASGLSTIEAPSTIELHEAQARGSAALQSRAVSDFQERVFGCDGMRDGGPASAPYYAYHTVRVAAAQFDRSHAPALLCPVTTEFDVMTWLELLWRLLPSRARPLGALWTSGKDARLVVSLSDLPPVALHAAVGCRVDSPRIWPLFTTNETARAKARSLIEPLMPPASATLSTTIDALAQGSPA